MPNSIDEEIYITQKMEEFSRAYVHAVTAVAGFKIYPPATPDDESIDLSIGSRGTRGKIHSPRIDAQLKSWRRKSLEGRSRIH